MRAELADCVLGALRDEPKTFAGLKAIVGVHDVPLKLAILNLQQNDRIEHGYIAPDGTWLDDYFPDDSDPVAPEDGWRVCQ